MKSYAVVGRVGDGAAYCTEHSHRSMPPIFADSESDTPTHCDECGVLIDTTPTEDAIEYVRKAIASAMSRDDARSVAINAWPEWAGISSRTIDRVLEWIKNRPIRTDRKRRISRMNPELFDQKGEPQ